MNDITREQAARIHDLESYKEITGAKRFKRTKEEMELGLSPEDALQRRLNESNDLPAGAVGSRDVTPRKRPRPSTSSKGDIVIRIRPEAEVDSIYFEHVPNEEIEFVLDEKWFSWLHEKAEMPYEGDVRKMLEHILHKGMGEVITTMHFPEDIEE